MATNNSDTKNTFLEGRAQNLTGEQKLVLQKVWAQLLLFWGVKVKVDHILTPYDKKNCASEKEEMKEEEKAEMEKHTIENKHTKKKSHSGGWFGSHSSSKKKEHEEKAKLEHKLEEQDKENKSIEKLNNTQHESDNEEDNGETFDTRSNRSAAAIEESYPHCYIHDSLKDLKPEEIKEEFWNMLRVESPDNLLLRYIRARKWNIDKSLVMISRTFDWRLNKLQPDKILREGEKYAFDHKMDGLIKNYESMKASIRGVDLGGHPIVLVRVKLHHPSEQTEEEVERYALTVIEEARLFLKEPIDQATIVFDLTGFSLSNMEYSPVKFLIECFEAHYPECLSKFIIHKAPWVFNSIWSIIKNWLDPVVASKFIFTKGHKDLLKYIALEHIPEYLSGGDKYNYHYQAPGNWDELDSKLNDHETRDLLISKRDEIIGRFIYNTVQWIETGEDGFFKERLKIGEEFKNNYIELDPYLRSRSYYDWENLLKL
ncbi:related to Phosphatidylinositol transfer protein CSR1 [Saccharomycodes ludwigii]|uniref:Related to Phosphatidylinositol transfer protein CSR1 n=1 Tax=Saccharomycodes ludwigii TaxID=36035 RepID=A0A376B3A7_9ASCO|nr:related to Phosphatidylinositol transfer protein CSR1 [Saccharomycodes ludwigii]